MKQPRKRAKDSAAPEHSRDSLSAHAQEVNALAAALPNNRNTPLEHGHENALAPREGPTAAPESHATTGSTLTIDQLLPADIKCRPA